MGNIINNAYPYLEEEDEQWCEEDIAEEKDSYIKHIRLDLSQYQSYCPADAMAKAIGGAFTGEFVQEICQDSKWPVKNFERQGKCYVEIATFLEKLKAGLTFSDSPV